MPSLFGGATLHRRRPMGLHRVRRRVGGRRRVRRGRGVGSFLKGVYHSAKPAVVAGLRKVARQARIALAKEARAIPTLGPSISHAIHSVGRHYGVGRKRRRVRRGRGLVSKGLDVGSRIAGLFGLGRRRRLHRRRLGGRKVAVPYVRRGRGVKSFLSNVYNASKPIVSAALRKVLRQGRVALAREARNVPVVGNALSGGIHAIGKTYGLGRRRRLRRGRGIISKGLGVGSDIAGLFGFGRRKRRLRRGVVPRGARLGRVALIA